MSAEHVTHRRQQSPILLLAVGLFCAGMWIGIVLLQLQTSMALMLSGKEVTVQTANWGVFVLFWELVTGQLYGALLVAVTWAYMVELVTLIFAVALKFAMEAASQSHQKLPKWWVIASIVLLLYNAYSDFSYGTLYVGSWVGNLAFSLVCGMGVCFLLPIAFRLIEGAIDGWKR